MPLDRGKDASKEVDMYLKRIEIAGFKSFARKTVMEFPQGITAIVGPNGSGKSNVIDAVRWVLGEQSAKALRGNKMEEVIFGGSDKKGSLSIAEVTIVFDNYSRRLPLEFEEVAVTRRIDRSGASEYLLNNTPCRLKEILDLFMGTGVGHGTYCIIGSDEIDLLLSSNPMDRRLMVEEVAAVNKYKYKKREASRKLEQTQQNLVRIHDLRMEVFAQLSGLAAQKERAQEYFALKKEIDEISVTLILDALAAFDKRRAQMLAAREGLEQKRIEKENAVISARQELEKLNESLRALRTSHGKEQTKQEEIKLLLERKQGERNLLEEKVAHAESAIERLDIEICECKKRIADLEVEEGRVRQEVDSLVKSLDILRDELLGKRESLDALDERERDRRLYYEETSAKYKELASILALRDKELGENKQRLASRREELEHVDADMLRQKEAFTSLEIEKRRINAVKDERESASFELSNLLKVLRTDLSKELEYRNILNKQLSELKEEFNVASEKLNLLLDLETSLAGFSDGAKAVIKWGEKNDGVVGALGTLIEITAGYEQAIDVAFGRHIQDIIVKTPDIAEKAIDFLKREEKGRSAFLPLTFFNKEAVLPELPKQSFDGFVARAVDVVECEAHIRPIINKLLGKVLLFENLSKAIGALSFKSNENLRDAGFTIVTLDGELIAPLGSVTGGSLKKQRDTVFGRHREIKDTKTRLAEISLREGVLQTDLSNCSFTLKNLEEKINITEQKFAGNNRLVEESERELIIIKTRYDHLLEEENRLVSRKQTVELDMEKFKEDISSKIEEIKLIEDNLIKIEEEVKVAAKALEGGQQERDLLRDAIHAIEVQMAQQEEINRSFERRLADMVAQHREQSGMIKSKEHDNNEIKERTERLLKEKQDYDGIILDLICQQDQSVSILGAIEEDIKRLENDFVKANVQMEKLVKEEERQRERRHELELQQSILETQRQQEVERLTAEFPQVSPHGISYEGEIKELERLLSEKKTAQHALGPVNFSAVEDYNRLEERHEFLTTQESDLTSARTNLEKMIADLDGQSIKQFKETFEALNTEFGAIFGELFKGGRGALRLTNPDNILESGVDVLAQPPGKKMQNLHLLSSGEKALTGIAFLLAILRVKPSPFCLLDEIDAPLDDANIDRFSSKLQEYAHASQFIVVTHNRKTMQTASTLYGVTMDEPGVSKVMSLRLNEVWREEPHELVHQN